MRVRSCILRLPTSSSVALVIWSLLTSFSEAATSKKHYFAHDAVEDQYGVIAPWYSGLNGQLDLRVRVTAETLKRYPWTNPEEPFRVPAYVVSGRWEIGAEGTIQVLPASEWGNEWGDRDFGYRAYYILSGLVDYYRYTGDPWAIAYVTLMADHLLDHGLTPETHPWPRFPISVPEKFIQLDVAAQEGLALLEAYQLVGNPRWLAAAKHWADLLAENMRADRTDMAPWDRYATEESSRHESRLTGGVALILEFLEALTRLGFEGRDGKVVEARDASRKYITEILLPAWTVDETWGRYFWDWDAAVQTIATTDSAVRCFMADREQFPSWESDSRNIISLYLNRTSVDPASGGDVYSGAWAYPESSSCCTRSLNYAPMEMAAVLAQYGVLADNEWARELARRQMILSTYDFHENGIVEDNIDGGQIVAGTWFKIVHPMSLKYALQAIAWLPEIFGADRENHIVRSASVVTSVVYGKDKVQYSTFDAPQGAIDVLRLAYVPKSVTAGGKSLRQLSNLDSNGYVLQKLGNGDCIASIRHDGLKSVVVEGPDPQDFVDDRDLGYEGQWNQRPSSSDIGGGIHVTNASGAAVIIPFKGNQIRVLGRSGPSGGLAEVFLDGTREFAAIDCWNPSQKISQQVLYYKNGLPNQEHLLKIVALGKGNPRAVGSDVWIDAVLSSEASARSGFGAGGGPTETQRMIFGYPRRIPYVDSKGEEWFPGTEFVVRSGKGADSVSTHWWVEPETAEILNTDDPGLYRYGVHAPEFWVNVTVGPGTYYVKLGFFERRGNSDDPSSRLMRIQLNGQTVAEDLDIVSIAGNLNQPVDLTFNKITPLNGVIEVRLSNSHGGEALLQALEVGLERSGTQTFHQNRQ